MIDRIKKTPTIELISRPARRCIYMDIGNKEGTPFADIRVRKAIAMAINEDEIIRTIMRGQATPAAQVPDTATIGYDPSLKRLAYDPSGAKALLKEAGFPDGFEITIAGPNDRYINDDQICQAVAKYLPLNWINMARYITKRLLQGIVVLLAVSFICFLLFRYTGDPVLMLAGKYVTQAEREQVRKVYGLDRPFYVQYASFLGNAVKGNFGKFYVSQVSALDTILERFPATFELAFTAILISFTIGVSLGILVSIKPDGLLSRFIMAGSLGGISIPTFLSGILLVMIFAVYLEWLPPFGRGDTITIGPWRSGLLTLDGLKHIIMPALTLSGMQLAVLLRLTCAGMREALSEEYIKTAWAKGLSPFKVIVKHALRNVLIPVVTIAGLTFGELIAYSIVTESIFQWPGMGNLLFPGATLILLVVAINLFSDWLRDEMNPKLIRRV